MPWLPLVDSAEVPDGAVRAATVGELDLVVWRTHGGQPVVMDARCPHQWSHLEAEGVVDGDEIVCTSHFWRFGADGCGTKLNVNGRRDDKGPTVVYRCREVAGRVEALVPDAGSSAVGSSAVGSSARPDGHHDQVDPADEEGRNPDAGPRVIS